MDIPRVHWRGCGQLESGLWRLRIDFRGEERRGAECVLAQWTMSPGTRSRARTCCTPRAPTRVTFAISGSYSLSASMALSALRSCQTPTQAFAMRIRRITSGSTNALKLSSCSSNHASTCAHAIRMPVGHWSWVGTVRYGYSIFVVQVVEVDFNTIQYCMY